MTPSPSSTTVCRGLKKRNEGKVVLDPSDLCLCLCMSLCLCEKISTLLNRKDQEPLFARFFFTIWSGEDSEGSKNATGKVYDLEDEGQKEIKRKEPPQRQGTP